MNRIYYQGSFKLAMDWPEPPKQCAYHNRFPAFCDGSKKANGDIIPCRCKVDYLNSEAVTSAMENGVEFADQERVMNICHNKYSNILIEEELKTGTVKEIMPFQYWQPKDGDNWPAPEGAEIVEQDNHIEGYIWKTSKVAVLRSEGVEKKETPSLNGILPCPFCGIMPEWYGEAIPDSQYYLRCPECQFIMKFDRRDKVIGMWNRRVNQSTPKQ